MIRSTYYLLTLCLLVVGVPVRADLIITGVVDGTQPGGNPRAMELLATTDIGDLSTFFIVRDTDGTAGGPFTVSSFISLPSVGLSAGDFYYIYSNSTTESYLEAEGFGDTSSDTALVDGILNFDGNDILAVATASDGTGVVDAFGLLGQGDNDFAQDSIAYRKPNTPANATGVLDAGNFDIAAYSDITLGATFGTYELAAVPEPSAFALSCLICGALATRQCFKRQVRDS